MAKKKHIEQPAEILPAEGTPELIPPIPDPDELPVPDEEPDIIPDDDPFETPPYEVPPPGESP
jgi:hypothetical protein